MRTTRSEAVDLFRRWFEEGLPVRWQGSFSNFAFSSWGRIVSLDDVEIRLISGDKNSELVVRFSATTEFGYVDNTNVTGPEKRFGDAIGIFFGPVPPWGAVDTITLAALED